jgi:predicted nucleic-acid-binding protein
MQRKFVDANVLLQFLIRDDEGQFQKVSKEIAKAKAGSQKLVLVSEVIAEVVYVMMGVYQVSRLELASVLQDVVRSDYLEVPDRVELMQALTLFGSSSLDFVDVLLMARAKKAKADLLTYDKKVQKAFEQLT